MEEKIHNKENVKCLNRKQRKNRRKRQQIKKKFNKHTKYEDSYQVEKFILTLFFIYFILRLLAIFNI